MGVRIKNDIKKIKQDGVQQPVIATSCCLQIIYFSSFQTRGRMVLVKPLGSYVQPRNLLWSRVSEWK